jgi:hypothetical protein
MYSGIDSGAMDREIEFRKGLGWELWLNYSVEGDW